MRSKCVSCFQLPSHLLNTPSLCAAPLLLLCLCPFFSPLIFQVYVSCHLFLTALLNFLALEAECINPLSLPLLHYLCCHGFVHHSFTFTAGLSPELILGHRQPLLSSHSACPYPRSLCCLPCHPPARKPAKHRSLCLPAASCACLLKCCSQTTVPKA